MDSYGFNRILIGIPISIGVQQDFNKLSYGFLFQKISIGIPSQQDFTWILIGFLWIPIPIGFQQGFLFQQEFNRFFYFNRISIGIPISMGFESDFKKIIIGFVWIPMDSIRVQQVFNRFPMDSYFNRIPMDSYGLQDVTRNSYFNRISIRFQQVMDFIGFQSDFNWNSYFNKIPMGF